MRSRKHVVAAAALVTMGMGAGPAFAQPSRPSDEVPPVIEKSEKPVSKSDAYRVVGKVTHIDQQAGVFKLQTEEGVVTARPAPDLLRAARVGDTVSVPRGDNDAPSASPRTSPRTR